MKLIQLLALLALAGVFAVAVVVLLLPLWLGLTGGDDDPMDEPFGDWPNSSDLSDAHTTANGGP
jgi:hypothetical protein